MGADNKQVSIEEDCSQITCGSSCKKTRMKLAAPACYEVPHGTGFELIHVQCGDGKARVNVVDKVKGLTCGNLDLSTAKIEETLTHKSGVCEKDEHGHDAHGEDHHAGHGGDKPKPVSPTPQSAGLRIQSQNAAIEFGPESDVKLSRSGPATMTVQAAILQVLGQASVETLEVGGVSFEQRVREIFKQMMLEMQDEKSQK